jgi:phosphohistidine phosphatase
VTAASVKTLHLLRHAKSDWSDATLADHDRPLSGRGRKARKTIARHIRGWPVDLVVCSTAVRTRSTAKPVVEALGCPVRYEAGVYLADADALLAVVRALPDTLSTVMLVGHNPGMEDLAEALCGSTPLFPTAALATIELGVDHWHEVERGCGRLTAFTTAAELTG